jgi:uncharacterized membrane protein
VAEVWGETGGHEAGTRPARNGERITRWAMIGVGLAIWAVAVAWPGMRVAILVLSGALVAWAAFGLLTDR